MPADRATTRQVAIALGSNLGDRNAHLRHAVDRLGEILGRLKASFFYETAPEGVHPQAPFLNAAVVGVSALSAEALLERLLAIEAERGRTRLYPGAPRTLDLDLILVGDLTVSSPVLEVPHPRFRERRFVLEPLAEVAPELVDPVTKLTVRELLARLG